MCFHAQQTQSAEAVYRSFGTKGPVASGVFNGFTHPQLTVITDTHPQETRLQQWGLIPHWAKDNSIQRYTLNARVESLAQRPAYRSAKRCLILVDGFFEWQWLDPQGKRKQKHLITHPHGELFALAGLWDQWVDRQTGEIVESCSIVTTAAIGVMCEIHNSKQRMPFALVEDSIAGWLCQNPVLPFHQFNAQPI